MRARDRKAKDAADEQADEPAQPSLDLVTMTAAVVRAYVANNRLLLTDITLLIQSTHIAIAELAAGVAPAERLKPAVPIKKSYGDDYLICLEDGKKLTMLKRYLKTHYDMSPEQYRAKWSLPADYPMVAPAYARLRSAFAKRIGLGGKATRRGRKSKDR